MVSHKSFHDKILDPFDSDFYREVMKDGQKTLINDSKYSNIILARESSRLLEILENDSVVNKGLRLLSSSVTDNRKINVQLSAGRILQDYRLIDVYEDVNLDLYIYTHHNIVNVNVANNWFEISGSYLDYFPVSSVFAVTDSTANDKLDYSVFNVQYDIGDNNRTRITVSTGISDATIDGKIVCRRFPDNFENYGRVIVSTQFDYIDSVASGSNILKMRLDYLDRDNNISSSFSLYENKIILTMLEFERNGTTGVADDTAIADSTLKEINFYDTVTIEGGSYQIYNESNIDSGLADGGRIN